VRDFNIKKLGDWKRNRLTQRAMRSAEETESGVEKVDFTAESGGSGPKRNPRKAGAGLPHSTG
jgi:hypothetical protein